MNFQSEIPTRRDLVVTLESFNRDTFDVT